MWRDKCLGRQEDERETVKPTDTKRNGTQGAGCTSEIPVERERHKKIRERERRETTGTPRERRET